MKLNTTDRSDFNTYMCTERSNKSFWKPDEKMDRSSTPVRF